ncbi:hypothetical protein [Asticcacaulis sp. AND118]|uniref:hypothetical protein n=1 Tax=Asticcacaulis sp. AND118 TaxID=2840468 RepID=UPI001CFF7F57|nr:hypothetical protein [Asticcacaulis sp. AND118]UDF03080.1 hypothetical protein LH365_11650 [Asticcacaulis sp. AND118]
MFRAAVIAACLTGVISAPAVAETAPPAPVQIEYFQLRLTVPQGGRVRQTLTRTTHSDDNGKVVSSTVTAEFLSQLVPHEDGYRVVKTRVKGDFRIDSGSDGQDRADLEKLMQAAGALTEVSYIADINLTPLRIEQWPVMRNRLKAAMRRSGAIKAREADAFDAMYGPMSPEAAADLFLPEDALLAIPHNLGLSLNNPYRLDSVIAGPFGGTISASETLTLTRWDQTAGEAEVLYEAGPTREALDAYALAIRPTLERAALDTAKAEKSAPAPVGALALQIGTTCRYRVSLKTGLVVRAECQSLRDVRNGDDRRLHRETWVLGETPA